MSDLTMQQRPSNLGYLRVKTEHNVTPVPEEVLTPISAKFDHRRSSLTSNNWSFVSNSASDESHPSSVSSYRSFAEPITPPYHGLPVQTMTPPVHTMTSEWPNPSYSASMRMPNYRNDEMMPAASDFSDALGASLANANPTSQPNALNRSWNHTGHLSALSAPVSYTSHGYAIAGAESPVTNVYQSPLSGHSFSHDTAWPMPASAISLPSSTIIPTATMVNTAATFNDHPPRDLDFGSPLAHRVSDSASFNDAYQSDSFSFHDNHTETFSDESHEPKPRRKSTRASMHKKKSRPVNYTTKNGDLLSVSVVSSKPHACNSCGKRFQRVEHLRRHEQTHNPAAVAFYCPDPDCLRSREKNSLKNGKTSAFMSRNDNFREHFRTHLRVGGVNRRNKFYGFEEFYALIRSHYPAEDAEKYIKHLEKWRKEGGHLEKAGKGAGR